MVDNASGTGGTGPTAIVGKVFVIFGEVKAVAPDGTTRVLAPNSPVFADDRIVTGSDGRISITFNDRDNTVLTLGRNSNVVINEEVYGQEPLDDFADVQGEVADIQQALEQGEFDPTTQFEPTAAGPAAAGGPGGVASARDGGASYPVFFLTGDEVIPDSGAETTGVGLTFLDPDIPTTPPEPTTPPTSQPLSDDDDDDDDDDEGGEVEDISDENIPQGDLVDGAQENLPTTGGPGSLFSIAGLGMLLAGLGLRRKA